MNYSEYCETCKHYKFSLQKGVLCGLTNEKPQFEGECEDFALDEEKREKSEKQKRISTHRIDPELQVLREKNDWLLCVGGKDDSKQYFNNQQLLSELRDKIIHGLYKKYTKVVVHFKDEDGNWGQKTTTLRNFADNYFELRTLYKPVWTHAMAGLKWGIIIGVLLKLLDTFLMIAYVNMRLAVLFATAIGVIFIPRFGWIALLGIGYAMAKYSEVNLFFTGLAAAMTGAILGCLPGMFVGGAIGLYRKQSLPTAPDADPEPQGLFLKTVLLPFIGGTALILFYIFVFNPWLMKVLE